MFNIETITRELSDGIATFQKSIENTNEYVKNKPNSNSTNRQFKNNRRYKYKNNRKY